ncbi:MAG: PhoX family phosphatase [Crocinitomicaceae bacterium]
MNFTLILTLSLIILSCQSKTGNTLPSQETGSMIVEEVLIDTTPLFTDISSDFKTETLLLPTGFTYQVLFSEGDEVVREDQKGFPAKGNHDLTVFIPDSLSPSTKGWVYISHETKSKDIGLGDGGGATMFQIELIDSNWQVVSNYEHIDFSEVGYTNRNCGGSITPYGTILTCEESWSHNTEYLYMNGTGLRDTSWVNGRPAYQNMGFVVEVDPKTRKAIKKHYQMGKFVHEDVHCSVDGKAVYLTDDMNPAVFFKFVPNVPYEYESGKLFAFQESETGEMGTWLEMPNDTAAWLDIRNVALKAGATMYVRHEWIVEHNGKLYISETGQDDYNLTQSHQKGGQFSSYAKTMLRKGNYGEDFDDPYGRILVFDPKDNSMRSYIEGGVMMDSVGVFSNPDCNTVVTIRGKSYLVLSEDLIGLNRGRSGENPKHYQNELYFLDLSIENPTVNDLKRFAISPRNSETTGVVFTPDGKHMILNIQHPDRRNPAPFNKSCTIIVSGF